MEQRLIDANAYAAEMKTRQDACKEIMDAAKEDDNWELYDRMGAEFSIFIEAKLTLDAMPTVDAVPVVRCKDCVKRPPATARNGDKPTSDCPLWCGYCFGIDDNYGGEFFCGVGARE